MKNKLNFVIDAVMFLAMMALAGIGFLMNWVLLPGREARAVYGPGVELGYLGLDRHQWGDVHLVVGFVLLGLLVLHTVLHWNQVLHLFCKLMPRRPGRIVAAILFFAASLALVSFPLLAHHRIEKMSVAGQVHDGGGGGGGRGGGRGQGR